jgi:hypothetical protein
MFQLDKGIFLEDTEVLLEWGQPIEKLARVNKAEINREADRTIIKWGTHLLLNGLKLELSNTFVLSRLGKFTFIESTTNSDKQSFDNFEIISNHLLSLFGDPTQKEDSIETKKERTWSWLTKDVKINLYLFEQHAFKLHLKIEQRVS